MKQNKPQNQTNHYISDNSEIPKLNLYLTRSTADFEKETINLEVKGWTMNECIFGMNYLIEKIERINKSNANNKAKPRN